MAAQVRQTKVVWYRRVIAGAVVGAILAASIAIVTGVSVWANWNCELHLFDERVGSEVVSRRSLPPQVECRYHYIRDTQGEPLYPAQNERHDTLPSVTIGTALVVVAILADRARRRTWTHVANS